MKGIPALIILNPCSNFLGFTVGDLKSRAAFLEGFRI